MKKRRMESIEVLVEPGKIWIKQEGVGSDDQMIEVSPEQVPLLKDWLEHAAKEAQALKDGESVASS